MKQYYPYATKLAALIASITISTSALAAIADFHGYARTGTSTTASGGSQYCYNDAIDGAHYVGRLGDECDTYGEIGLGKAYQAQGGAEFYLDSMFSFQTVYQGNDYQSITNATDRDSRGDWALRQINAQVKKLLPNHPEATLWIGKRFYQRKDIHILDLYYLNDSGNGFGIENYAMGPGKLSFAWIDGARKPALGKNDAKGEPVVQTEKLDLRYQDIPLWENAKLNLAYMYGRADLTDIQDESGESEQTGNLFSLELEHQIGSAKNTFVAQYGRDALAGSVFNNSDGTTVDTYNDWSGDLESAYRVIYFGQASFADKVDVAYSALYASGDTVSDGAIETSPSRFSIVTRPSYYWNSLTRTTLELGYSKAQMSTDSESQDLSKIVLAQEITPDVGLMTRPSLRIYVGSFFGDIAKSVRSAKDDGDDGELRFGAQMEAWW